MGSQSNCNTTRLLTLIQSLGEKQKTRAQIQPRLRGTPPVVYLKTFHPAPCIPCSMPSEQPFPCQRSSAAVADEPPSTKPQGHTWRAHDTLTIGHKSLLMARTHQRTHAGRMPSCKQLQAVFYLSSRRDHRQMSFRVWRNGVRAFEAYCGPSWMSEGT